MGTSVRVNRELPLTGRGSGLVSAALLIAGVTVVARIIGFLRFAVLARTVGTSCLGDVYASANAVPNVVYELVIGGALAAVVVPLVAGRNAGGDPEQVRQTVAALHGWVLTLLIPVTVLGYLLSGVIVDLFLGSGCDSAKASSTGVAMLWVFLLQIPVYGVTVVAQGALQGHRRFLAPAIAPAISSLVVIGGYLLYAQLAGADRGSLEALTTGQFIALAGGTTARCLRLDVGATAGTCQGRTGGVAVVAISATGRGSRVALGVEWLARRWWSMARLCSWHCVEQHLRRRRKCSDLHSGLDAVPVALGDFGLPD